MSKQFFSQPNNETVQEHDGKILRRNLPKICPVCSSTFYAYRYDGQDVREFEVERQDMVPSYNGWLKFRQTCGDPSCYLTEERRWLRLSPAYQQAIEIKNNQFAELNETRRQSLRDVKPREMKPIKLFSLEDNNV